MQTQLTHLPFDVAPLAYGLLRFPSSHVTGKRHVGTDVAIEVQSAFADLTLSRRELALGCFERASGVLTSPFAVRVFVADTIAHLAFVPADAGR